MGGALDATVIVAHSAETQELQQSAEGVANYFATGTTSSTHATTDSDTIVQSVPLDRVCYGTGEGGANGWTLQIEQAGVASQDLTQWLDAYSRATITNTAAVIAEMIKYKPLIRPVFLDANALLRGERYGVTSHGEIHAAWPQGDFRYDPGPAYPWGTMLAMVTHEPSEADFLRFLATLAEVEERNMAKARLARAIDGPDTTTTWLVGATTKTKVDAVAGKDVIAELKYADMVLPNPRPTGMLAIGQDPNGVEHWHASTLAQFTTV
jgi:hypothetical protein